MFHVKHFTIRTFVRYIFRSMVFIMGNNVNEIFSFELDQLEQIVAEFGQPRYRAKQLYEWLHTHNARSYHDMTNLPKQLRERLIEVYPIESSSVIEERVSQDLSRKFVLKLPDNNLIETVGILSPESNHLTVCFSTQVGCSMGCIFCATGRECFTRNISSQEIIDQILTVHDAFGMRISNLVAMGQGEPFLNYDNLLEALRRANSNQGLNIGARHITISTCGILDGIIRLADEPEQFTLAISLHSAIQSKRNQLIPRLSNQPLDELHDALVSYQDKKGRRITFEYILIDGVNCSKKDLDALIEYCSGLFCHINLIPLNCIDDLPYIAPDNKIIYSWEHELNSHGISATVRNSKGSDIAGACGQLKNSLDNVSRETLSTQK